ncbi:hypothetical protein [Methanohalobium sp.]|uniref:hypothetical protein n=1 Tax=Methanohalobium sp. TaxID=2837493 RepID=UPI00397E6CD6
MKSIVLAIFIILLSCATFGYSAYAQPANIGHYQYIDINEMTIEFNDNNAEAKISYDLDLFAQMYVLILGSRNLEPTFNEIFNEFGNFKIAEIGKSHAVLMLDNVSRQSGEYYLHDSRKLGTNVGRLILIYPEETSKVVENTNSTPNTFYSSK